MDDSVSHLTMAYPDEEFLLADGFNEAILGVDETTLRVIYSVSGIIAILMQEGMNEEDAYEHFYFNIASAYVGDKTPIYCNDNFKP